jgi:prevent-host-death family protein
MRSMTDAQASLNFAAMLDEVAKGETVLVTRDGVPIARITTPEESDVVDRLEEVLEMYPLPEKAVDDLERAIREHREWVGEGMREWPTD